MTLPPERISVKRRRDDTAIETFLLEERDRAKKSRVDASAPNFQFKLVKGGTILPKSLQPDSTKIKPFATKETQSHQPSHDSDGIPIVRTTAPGDEINDFIKFKQERRALSTAPSGAPTDQIVNLPPANDSRQIPTAQARRFHLTRQLSSSYGVHTRPVGRGSGIRPPLPTFIERQHLSESTRHNSQSEAQEFDPLPTEVNDSGPVINNARGTEGVQDAPPSVVGKNGRSLNDPSQTWNRDSDQLADELAALAMDMDPDQQVVQSPPPKPNKVTEAKKLVQDDDYIYETYIRMPLDSSGDTTMLDIVGSNVGVLVIDEADEELWQEYMESDEEDDEWDDEDSNAEDNPANDYPDEEISSDDEYDRNAYRYHRSYDEDRYDSDDDE